MPHFGVVGVSMNSERDLDRVIEGLSETERRAILGKTRWLSYEQALEWPLCGTIERMADTPHKWQATPLGLAVRARLLSQQSDQESER